jgi:hypothetical protein
MPGPLSDGTEALYLKMRRDEALRLRCSAVKRRFSPDMKLRWMPTIDGTVIADPPLPFSGFDTCAEAAKAAWEYLTHETGGNNAS